MQWWRPTVITLALLAGGTALVSLAFRGLGSSHSVGFSDAINVPICIAAFILAAILLCRPAVALSSSWLGDMLGGIFHPTRPFKEPAPELLKSIRTRIEYRQHLAAEQQVRGLIAGFGPSPELYHLLLLNTAAQDLPTDPVLIEASKRLPGPQFRRFSTMAEADPPRLAPRKVDPAANPAPILRAFVEPEAGTPVERIAWKPGERDEEIDAAKSYPSARMPADESGGEPAKSWDSRPGIPLRLPRKRSDEAGDSGESPR